MEPLSIIIISVFFVCAGILFLLFRTLYKQLKDLRVIHRQTVSVDKPYLADAAIIEQAPVAVRVGAKTLFLRPLNNHLYTVYIAEMIRFFELFASRLTVLSFMSTGDIYNENTVQEIISQWKKNAYDKKLNYEMTRIIVDLFLKDKRVNPQGITRKYLLENTDWNELVQIFLIMRAVNVEAVQPFIRSLTGQLQGAKQIAGSGCTLLPGGVSNQSGKSPLVPRY